MNDGQRYATILVRRILWDIGSVCAEHDASILVTLQETDCSNSSYSWIDLEIEACGCVPGELVAAAFRKIPGIQWSPVQFRRGEADQFHWGLCSQPNEGQRILIAGISS